MEDWLNDNARVELNLAESGCADYLLGNFLRLCGADIHELESLWLGNNDTRGSLELRRAVCDCYESVELDELIVANGTSEALFAFFNELLDPGDEVVVPIPAFQCLHEIPRAIGCDVVELDLMKLPGWRLDVDALASKVTEQTKLIIINTPHNPVGWTLSVDELAAIAELAGTVDATLLFDEHYRYLPLEPGTELTPSGYDVCKPRHAKTFATGSMIKCLGVVGIRIGWLIGDPEMLDRCRDYKDYLTHTIPILTDHIARLGLEHRDAIIEDKKRDILPNLAALEQFMAVNEDLFEHVTPTGGVVCFPRLRRGVRAADFCRNLVKNHGVSLLPGFGFGVSDHVRLNIGVEHRRFLTALDRIKLEAVS
jgi:aspartate/methionine/tyrosine aminotransferase